MDGEEGALRQGEMTVKHIVRRISNNTRYTIWSSPLSLLSFHACCLPHALLCPARHLQHLHSAPARLTLELLLADTRSSFQLFQLPC